MSAYNQVPRLSTGPKMAMHHDYDHHNQQHQEQLTGNGNQPPPLHFDRNYPNAKQRKWRVLVSIGLLLPALAAIIGIVAWTISIEVTSNNGAAEQRIPIHMAQRRAERAQLQSYQQQQQFRRDEAIALAALVAARRSARQSQAMIDSASAKQQQSSTASRTEELPAAASKAQEDQLPVAAAVVLSAPAKVQQTVGVDTTRTTRSNRQQQRIQELSLQSQAITSNKQQQQQQQQQQMFKKNAETSSLMLKNLNQVEALNEAASGKQEPTASPETNGNEAQSDHQANENDAEERQMSMSEQNDASLDKNSAIKDQNEDSDLVSARKPESSGESAWTTAQADTLGVSSDVNASEANSRLMEQQQTNGEKEEQVHSQQGRDESSSSETNQASRQMTDDESLQPMVSRTKTLHHNGATKDAKSRWSMSGSNKRPLSDVDSSVMPVVTRKFAALKHSLVHHNQFRLADNKRHQELTKTNSKYTLLSTGKSVDSQHQFAKKQQNVDDELQPTEVQATNPNTTEKPALSSSSTLAPSQADCHERTEATSGKLLVEEDKPEVTRDASDDDDDISFEAIASAISKTLTAANSNQQAKSNDAKESNKQQADQQVVVSPSQTSYSSSSSLLDTEAGQSDDSGLVNDNSESTRHVDDVVESTNENAPSSSSGAQIRRRTTGEHLAEVIDHLVDRRKQQRQHDGFRFGDRSGLSHSDSDEAVQHGPQIVVVAPVGASGALLKARSLTRATDEIATEVKSDKPKKENTKSDLNKSGPIKKANVAIPRKPIAKTANTNKQTGARLLGVGPVLGQTDVKFSERVEVIRDEDSSSLLMSDIEHKSSDQQLSDQEDASIHVSSNSAEPRSRSPRHEQSISYMLERYAPMAKEFNEQPPQVNANSQAKLYSAEQLIRSHLMRAKSQNQQGPNQSNNRVNQQIRSEQQATSAPVVSSTTTTTERPPASSRAPEMLQQNRQQQQQQQRSETGQDSSMQKGPQEGDQFAPSYQPVQVPAFFIQQSALPTGQNQPNLASDQYQVMESQQHQVQTPESLVSNQQQQQQQSAQQQEYFQVADQQTGQNNQLMAQPLPAFADQEIQVPAHMAESVIRDLQQSPSTVTGMLNGRQMMFQALPQNHQVQVPQQQIFSNLQSQQQQLLQQQQQHHRFLLAQQQAQLQNVAESQQRPQFMSMAKTNLGSQQSSAGGYTLNPFSLVSRLVASRRQPQEQQQARGANQQVLANRDSAAKEDRNHHQPEQQRHTSTSIISGAKSLGPRSLVQPVAQMALKHLLSSISQQAESMSRQAAAQQAQLDAAELHHQRQHRSSPVPMAPSQSAQAAAQAIAPTGLNQPTAGQDSLQGAGSSPVGMAALPPQSVLSANQQTGPDGSGAASARSMRSLPIGAQAPASQQQVQSINDQEVQESYGQMPTYQMAEYGHGGGGGGGYGQYDNSDKKSKGITFHFGGGPIGGGTQLITSPMGIFKHLMIPLMPNPRVNLNGKVVFGVVLEKTTAFGPPPKKKYKFWGR